MGRQTHVLFGDAEPHAVQDDAWVELELLRVWVAEYDGYLFGSGWQRQAPGN